MFIQSAFAQTAGAPAAGGSVDFFGLFFPLLLILPFFYFLVLRPQQQRQRKFQAMIAAVKKGDQVVTAGGMVGKVTRVEELHVEVEIAANTRVRVVKSTLAEVTNPNAKPAND